MIKLEISTGMKFNYLTIIKEVERYISPKGQPQRQFLCKCDCGNEWIGQLNSLRKNHSKSCGCLAIPTRFVDGHIPKQFVDGHHSKLNKTDCYYISRLWSNIKNRCYNKNSPDYKHWGGRGIIMYKPWINNRPLFKEWILTNLGHRPEGHSIDRIDVNSNYEPDNLRWADKKTQVQNRRCMING